MAAALGDMLSRLGRGMTLEQGTLLKQVLELRKAKEEAAAALAAAQAECARLQASLDASATAFQCSICCSQDVDSVLIPCGHTMCRSCVQALRTPTCPFDRQQVKGFIPFYKPS